MGRPKGRKNAAPLTTSQRAYLQDFDAYLRAPNRLAADQASHRMHEMASIVLDEAGVVPSDENEKRGRRPRPLADLPDVTEARTA